MCNVYLKITWRQAVRNDCLFQLYNYIFNLRSMSRNPLKSKLKCMSLQTETRFSLKTLTILNIS